MKIVWMEPKKFKIFPIEGLQVSVFQHGAVRDVRRDSSIVLKGH